MHNDNYNNTLTKIALAPIAIASDTDTLSLVIPIAGFNSGKIALITGIVTAGDIAITKVEEATVIGMTDAVEIPSERLLGTLGTVLDTTATKEELGFIADTGMTHVRITFTSDNSAALLASASVELGNPAIVSTK